NACTIALAEQYAPFNVRINGLHPGPMPTSRWERLESHFAALKGISAEEARKRALSSIPMARLPELEEVADLVVFLASDRASYITGQSINIDGHQNKAVLHLPSGA